MADKATVVLEIECMLYIILGILDFQIPAFTLQPLVGNCVMGNFNESGGKCCSS